MTRRDIFSFEKTALLIFFILSAIGCGGKDVVQRQRGNIGSNALDLTRLSNEAESGIPSPEKVWIPLRPGSSLLVKGWDKGIPLKKDIPFVVTREKKAGIRIPFAPADPSPVDFTLRMKWISPDPAAGDAQETLPVKVLFNQKKAGQFQVKRSWDDFNLKVPADRFQMGSNYFVFYLGNKFFEGKNPKQTRGLALQGFWAAAPTAAVDFQVDRIVRRTLFSGGAMSIKLPEPLPERAELHFSLAVVPDFMPAGCEKVRYIMVAAPESSDSIRKTARFEYAWEAAPAGVENGSHQAERWCDARLSLREYAGKKVMLTLRAEAEPSTGDGFQAWGPLILTWDDPEGQRLPPEESEFNLLLLLVDTLRADRVGACGSDLGLTPGLDDMASKGIVFEDVLAQGSNTITSVSSFLTGRYFHTIHEWVDNGSLPSSNPRFAEAIRSAGFRTIALVANPLLVPETDFSRGYDEYDQKVEWLPAAELNRIFLSRLPILEKTRFFALLHYMDIHDPYGDPENISHAVFETGRLKGKPLTGSIGPLVDELLEYQNSAIGEADRSSLDRLYNEGIRYWDKQFSRLMAVLKERGLLERTVIMVMADHGEEIYDHGLISHGHTLYDELVHVPLVLLFPGKGDVRQPQRIQTPLQLLDAGPAVLDFLGIPVPPGHRGRSFLPILRGNGASDPEKAFLKGESRFFETRRRNWRRPPFNDYLAGIRKGEWKFILNRTSGEEKLFHIPSDPGETRNLIGQKPRIASELRDLLRAWEEKEGPPQKEKSAPKSTQEESDQVMHALRELGYVD